MLCRDAAFGVSNHAFVHLLIEMCASAVRQVGDKDCLKKQTTPIEYSDFSIGESCGFNYIIHDKSIISGTYVGLSWNDPLMVRKKSRTLDNDKDSACGSLVVTFWKTGKPTPTDN